MPIFEYRCLECGKSVEKLQRQPLDEVPCPACGQPAKRVVSPFSANNGSGCSAPSGGGFS